MITEIWRNEQRLDHLFDLGAKITELEMQAHWARYLCVLVSGYVEVSVAEILVDLAARKAHPAVASYVTNQLDRFQNAKMQRICDLLYSFDNDFGHVIETSTKGELKDAVDSLVANRNLIAHGRDVGISLARIADYYDKAKKVIRLVEQHCPA